MASFGELIGALMGWLGQLVEFLASFVPRFKFVRWNEKAVRYRGGSLPTEVGPGCCWYWPWKTTIIEYNTSRRVLRIPPIAIETKDGIPCSIGMIVVYRISDIIKYEVENFDTDDSISEIGQAALRNIVADSDWNKLVNQATDGSRLDGVICRRMQTELSKLGIEVESARPSDQIRISRVFRLFGVEPKINELKDEPKS